MAGTVTFAGIGSGMDVEGLISGLLNVEKQPISRLQSRQATADAAVTDLSDLSGLLSKLKTAASDLDTLQKVGSFSASTSNASAVAISANGNAQPGDYSVEVVQLAQTARRYSQGYSSANTALGLNGKLTLQIGNGDLQDPNGTVLVGAATTSIDVTTSDSLDSIIQKINGSGLRLQASTFYDGSQYRLSIRGLDTGDENTLQASGLDIGLNDSGNIVSQAQNAIVKIDGLQVSSKNNQISQAIPGVSIVAKQQTTSPFTISVTQDNDALAKKVTSFVDAYNAVVNKISSSAGTSKVKASNPMLAGDSALRSVSSRLSAGLTQTFGTGANNSLGAIGINLNNDGTLRLDRTKLDKALNNDSIAVSNLLAGDQARGTNGAMDSLRDLVDRLNDPSKGTVAVRKEGLQAQSKRFSDKIVSENLRLSKMEERLRTTFNAMDTSVAGSNKQLAYVQANL